NFGVNLGNFGAVTTGGIFWDRDPPDGAAPQKGNFGGISGGFGAFLIILGLWFLYLLGIWFLKVLRFCPLDILGHFWKFWGISGR
ncbi:hypothetical protein Nmel_018698, partial [Mimus melanotis]